MLTSKLLMISFTWSLALLGSILLRVAGIMHPNSFQVNPFFVWFLVFGPSIAFLVYFFVKKSISSNALI